MSGRLGNIPYPTVDPGGDLQTNPLVKYQNQLNPLAQLTDKLFTPPAAPQAHPIDPLMAQRMTAMGAQGMTPSATAMPPPLATPLPPSPPPGQNIPPPLMSPSGPSGPSGAAQLRGATAPPESTPGPGEGPHDLTQLRQDPGTGALVGRKAGSQPAPGSAALAEAGAPGAEPGVGPEAAPGGVPGGFTAPAPTPGKWTPTSRDDDRINTALASETKDRNPHLGADQQVGLAMAKAAKARPGQPSYHQKSADLIREHFGDQINFKGATTADEITERFVNHMRDNLLDLWNRVPGTWKERAKQWYVGANKIAHDWANEYGYHPRQMAGVIAALSPATDWFKNVGLAKRVIEYVRDKQGVATSPEMLKIGQAFTDKQKVPKVKEDMQRMLNNMSNKTFGQLTNDKERALWIRWHDTAHGDRSFQGISPEGEFLDTVRNKASKAQERRGELGNPATGGFLYSDPIRKALAILRSDDIEHISRNLGNQHKVRSFFNNIIAPFSKRGDITGDTHAIAAAMMQPLGQSHATVELGLGGTGPQSAEGLNGLYPYVAEAYRRAAKKVSTKDAPVLAREFQSVTWEAIRGIFSAAFKTNKDNIDANKAIWKSHADGKISAQAARNKVYEAAGAPTNEETGQREPRPPTWHTGEASVADEG